MSLDDISLAADASVAATASLNEDSMSGRQVGSSAVSGAASSGPKSNQEQPGREDFKDQPSMEQNTPSNDVVMKSSLVVSLGTKSLDLLRRARAKQLRRNVYDEIAVMEQSIEPTFTGKPFSALVQSNKRMSRIGQTSRRRNSGASFSRSRKSRKRRRHTEFIKGTDGFSDIDEEDSVMSDSGVSRRNKVRDFEDGFIESPPAMDTEKPREERNYDEFFPDLKDDTMLKIVRRPQDYFYNGDEMEVDQPEVFVNENSVVDGPVLFPKMSMSSLPKVAFKFAEDKLQNVRQDAARPSHHYIRFVDQSEEDLKMRVEYDMDEQDRAWLSLANSKRKLEGLPSVDEDSFELIIDVLEKEWFHLTKDLQKTKAPVFTHEDSICRICNDGEVENSNAIVFCDGCNLAVHQECYGVPYIPEGQWLCRKCMLSPEKPVKCVLCPTEGGAFKQTTTNQWAHLLCALWVPEVSVTNPVYMEPIDGIDKIPKGRWKLNCSLCKKKVGACIQCSKQSCFTAYHVTCARKAGLYMKVKHYNTPEGQEYSNYKSFCLRHSPKSNEAGAHAENQEESVTADASGVGSTQSLAITDTNHTETEVESSARSDNNQDDSVYNPQFPLAPDHIVQIVMKRLDLSKVMIRQKQGFVQETCRYWSLKRKARKGTSLLKRLHLEPWTMYSSEIKHSEAAMLSRLRILSYLRNDLETVRLLLDLLKKREKEKLKRYRLQMNYLYMKVCPLSSLLKRSLEEIIKLDKTNVFLDLVSEELVPDYYEVIKNPMCFSLIQKKIENFEYGDVSQFKEDLDLIFSNALVYNRPGTFFAKLALKLQARSTEIFENLKQSLEITKVDSKTGILEGEIPNMLLEYPSIHPEVLHPKPAVLLAPPPVPKVHRVGSRKQILEIKEEDIFSGELTDVSDPHNEIVLSSEPEIQDTVKHRRRDKVIKESSKPVKEETQVRPAKRLKTTEKLTPSTTSKSPQAASQPEKITEPVNEAKEILDIIESLKQQRNERQLVDGLDLCWIKIKGFPMFPGEIKPHADAPENLGKPQFKGKSYLAHFLDRDLGDRRTWAWIPESDMTPFDYGEQDLKYLKEAQLLISSNYFWKWQAFNNNLDQINSKRATFPVGPPIILDKPKRSENSGIQQLTADPKKRAEAEELKENLKSYLAHFIQPILKSVKEVISNKSAAVGLSMQVNFQFFEDVLLGKVSQKVLNLLDRDLELTKVFIFRCAFAILRALNKRMQNSGEKWRLTNYRHPALQSAETELSYLRAFVEDAWRKLGSDPVFKDYTTPSKMLHCLMKEAFVNRFAYVLVEQVTDPAWINAQLVRKAKQKILEHRLGEVLYQVLMENSAGFPPVDFINEKGWNERKVASMEKRAAYCDSLFKHAKRCLTMVDAKNVRYSLLLEIERTQKNMNANPERRETLEKQLKTLLMTKMRYEKRIISLRMDQHTSPTASTLTSLQTSPELDNFHTEMASKGSVPVSKGTKRDGKVLKKVFTTSLESTPHAGLVIVTDMHNQWKDLSKLLVDYHERKSENLFYFLQFMEKRGFERRVQFWLEVQNLREIIEERKDSEDFDSFVKAEVERLFQAFCNSESLLAILHPSTLLALKKYIQDDSETDYSSLFVAQNEVYSSMEAEDFPEFLKSEFYIRWRSDMERLTLNSPVGEDYDNQSNGATNDLLSRKGSFDELSQPNTNVSSSNDFDFAKSDLLVVVKRALKKIMKTVSNEYINSPATPMLTKPTNEINSPLNASRLFSLKTPLSAASSLLGDESTFKFSKFSHSNRSSVSFSGGETPLLSSRSAMSDPAYLIEADEDELVQRIPIQDRIDNIQMQLSLVEYLMKLYPKSKARDENCSHFAVLRKTREYLRRDLGDLVETKMSSDLFTGRKELDEYVWSVFLTPSGSKSKDSVYFLDVTVSDNTTGHTRSWIVPRRFDEFQVLHNQLKDKFPEVSDFSGKLFTNRINWHRSKDDMMKERNSALARYLQLLVENSSISKSELLRKFLADDSPFSRKSQQFKLNKDPLNDKMLFKITDSSTSPVNYQPSVSSSLKLSALLDDAIATSSHSHHHPSRSLSVLFKTQTRATSDHPLTPDLEEIGNALDRSVTASDEELFSYSGQSAGEELDESFRKEQGKMQSVSKRHPLIPRVSSPGPDNQSNSASFNNASVAALKEESYGDSWTYLSQPLANILLSMFNFQEKTQLLRESASLILLKQGLFGRQDQGGVDKKIEEYLYSSLDISTVSLYIQDLKNVTVSAEEYMIKNKVKKLKSDLIEEPLKETPSTKSPLSLSDREPLWKPSQLSKSMPHKSHGFKKLAIDINEDGSKQMIETELLKEEALKSFIQLIPLPFKRILGEHEAILGCSKLFELFQNKADNKSLIFVILDELRREFDF